VIRACRQQTLMRDIGVDVTPWFIATKRLDAASGACWVDFLAWSGLSQLTELVSLDSMLCPGILAEARDHYWPHIVNEDFMLCYFTNLDFMLAELPATADWSRINLLCVFRNPANEPQIDAAPFNSEFLGYDLCDIYGGPSALSNCGGFPLAFANRELSRHGLITDHRRALQVQRALKERYPEEAHAACHVWAIFRCTEPTRLHGA
jgi:hypothetical protein